MQSLSKQAPSVSGDEQFAVVSQQINNLWLASSKWPELIPQMEVTKNPRKGHPKKVTRKNLVASFLQYPYLSITWI